MRKCFTHDVLCIPVERRSPDLRRARTSSELLSSLDISPGTVMYYVDLSEGCKRMDRDLVGHAAHVSTGEADILQILQRDCRIAIRFAPPLSFPIPAFPFSKSHVSDNKRPVYIIHRIRIISDYYANYFSRIFKSTRIFVRIYLIGVSNLAGNLIYIRSIFEYFEKL